MIAGLQRIEPRHVGLFAGLAAIGAYVAWLMWLLQHATYDQWGAMIIGPILIILSLPILSHAARSADQPWFFGLATAALIFKLMAALGLYWVGFVYYHGSVDAAGYDAVGSQLAEPYRHGVFDVPLGSGGVGTHFIQSLTGVIYAITGPSLLGGYLVFSWIGFWGLLLSYFAFRTAVPQGHHHRYAIVVLFLPSLLFWSSAIGKEAWMSFGLGLSSYGVARLLTHRSGAFPLLAAGMISTGAVRPHVTLLVAVGLLAAYALRPSLRMTSLTPVIKVGGLVVLLIAAFVVLKQTASFLGVQDFSREGFQGALEEAQSRTARGGSQFAGAAVTSPIQVPWATVTLLFRPFPWEAKGLPALASSAEGMLLIYLTWRFRASLLAVPGQLRRLPYVTFSLTYLVGYILAFAGFANFGILVRQRSLALPAFLVLLAVPAVKPAVRRGSRALGVPERDVVLR